MNQKRKLTELTAATQTQQGAPAPALMTYADAIKAGMPPDAVAALLTRLQQAAIVDPCLHTIKPLTDLLRALTPFAATLQESSPATAQTITVTFTDAPKAGSNDGN